MSGRLEARPKIRSGHQDGAHFECGKSDLLALPKRIPLVVPFRGDDIEGIISDRLGRGMTDIAVKPLDG